MKNGSWKRRNFNLVEITIALMILGTGLIAILGVFPIAASNTRDAAGANYAAAAGEEILNYIAARVKDDWRIVEHNSTIITPDLADISAGAGALTTWGSPQLDTGVGASGVYYKAAGNDATYRIVIDTQTSTGVTVTAFDGYARVWKSPTTGFYYDGSDLVAGAQDSTYQRSAQLNIEITWPASIPYAGRSKASYALEVSRPND